MTKYIALLRGINVGGNNKLSMTLLKEELEIHNFKNVLTYINSGNILFESEDKDKLKLAINIEKLIKDKFSLTVPTVVLSKMEVEEALDCVPSWWDNDQNSKHNAIFVKQPSTAKEVVEYIGTTSEEIERVAIHGQIIFWSAPIKTFSKTKWSKVSTKPIYKIITIRNANTTKKLISL